MPVTVRGIDPDLARFAADVDWLAKEGVVVHRFNLAQQPAAFVEHAVVRDALMQRGTEVLPIVMIGDRIASEGTYPSRETLAALAGVVIRAKRPVAMTDLGRATASGCVPKPGGGKCC
jgi:hypothetical protein